MLYLARQAIAAALVLGSAASTVVALPHYCYCKGTTPQYTAYYPVDGGITWLPDDTLPSAREQLCMGKCEQFSNQGCNAFFLIDGTNFCLLSQLAFSYNADQGTTPSNYATISRGQCSLYGIDVTESGSSCVNLEYLPPGSSEPSPSKRARRRQLEQDRLQRHAHAAGAF